MAISLEEEDARIYDDFAEALREGHPAQAEQFSQLRRDEDSHRHRLLDLYRNRSGDHIPLIRRQECPVDLERTSLRRMDGGADV